MDKNEIIENIAKLGIQAFFIVSDNGFPIIDRLYNPTDLGLEGKSRVETLTSMISTVVRFNHQLVKNGLLSDIGLHTSRVYFDYLENIIFVLMVDENSIFTQHLYNIQTLLKGSISNIKMMFQAKLGSEINDPDLIDIDFLKSIFGDDLLRIIDQNVYDSYKKLLDALL